MSTPGYVSAPVGHRQCAHCVTPLEAEPTRITVRRVSLRRDATGLHHSHDAALAGAFACRACGRVTRVPLTAALAHAS